MIFLHPEWVAAVVHGVLALGVSHLQNITTLLEGFRAAHAPIGVDQGMGSSHGFQMSAVAPGVGFSCGFQIIADGWESKKVIHEVDGVAYYFII